MFKPRRLVCGLIALSLVGGSATASAQDEVEPAPTADSQSPTGVSYGNGAFSYEMPALSIGAGDFPQSLSLTYNYRSDGARPPASPWTTNWAARTHARDSGMYISACPPDCKPGDKYGLWDIVVGAYSSGFWKEGMGPGPGPYFSRQLDGATLTRATNSSGEFQFIYTTARGAKLTFDYIISINGDHSYPASWVEPDGTILTYDLSSGTGSISSNRGVSLYFEAPMGTDPNQTQKICALNLTQYYLPSISSCPTGVPTITIAGSTLQATYARKITSLTDVEGKVHTFTYWPATSDDTATDTHLRCVKDPGQSGCRIENTYDNCDQKGTADFYDPNANGSRDRVTSQTLATGETVTYSFVEGVPMSGNGTYGCRANYSTTVTQSGNSTIAMMGGRMLPYSVTDPLSRTKSWTWVGPIELFNDPTRLETATNPEGDKVEYTYDDRGNITERRVKAKPGSGQSDIVSSATYPSSCTVTGVSAMTCNKPITLTDAKGNTTSFTYDTTHGGMLTRTGPAVGGVQPKTRYSYTQRYAWIKNSTGGFSQATDGVWVLTEERSCNTSTLNFATGACSAGTSDLVVTTYDYGPDTGSVGNNLWLRGVVVTSGGTSLRTCYEYDINGNRISETAPEAGLSACY